MITQDYLKTILNYNIDTGQFLWIVNRGTNKIKNKIAGNINKGYIRIRINNKDYLAHRLAWVYVYGESPKTIDHINHNKLDNRLCNLRNVTHKENCKNRSKYKTNTSKIMGVYWNRRDNLSNTP